MIQNHLRNFRKKAGLSQAQLAEAIGAHWTTISRLENGKLEFTQEWAEKLAPVLKCSPFDLVSREMRTFPAYVAFGLRDKDQFSLLPSVIASEQRPFIQLEVPSAVPEKDYWYRVEDDSLFPQLQQGDLFHIRAIAVDQADRCIGHLCFAVSASPEGSSLESREFFGILARGKARETFCMRRLNAPDSEDFRIFILAKVDVIYPKPLETKDFYTAP